MVLLRGENEFDILKPFRGSFYMKSLGVVINLYLRTVLKWCINRGGLLQRIGTS